MRPPLGSRSNSVARKADKAMPERPACRREWIAMNAMEKATLKDLRKAAKQTQEGLAAALGVGQGAVSRLEKSDDMLLSTLRHYVECVGGRLEMVATFPDRPSLIINRKARK
jgi:DNA-binding XRE family transcriptional regulator